MPQAAKSHCPGADVFPAAWSVSRCTSAWWSVLLQGVRCAVQDWAHICRALHLLRVTYERHFSDCAAILRARSCPHQLREGSTVDSTCHMLGVLVGVGRQPRKAEQGTS